MHVFSFIPNRLLLSRKCYELIHYTGGSSLLNSVLYYFSFTAPAVSMLVHVERRYSQLPICTLLCGLACWQMARRRGPRRVLSKAVSAAAAIWWDMDGRTVKPRKRRKRQTESSLKGTPSFYVSHGLAKKSAIHILIWIFLHNQHVSLQQKETI